MTDVETAPDASLRRDLFSAYLATGSKILGWVIVSGLVYRFISVAAFSILALIRGTLGILNYTSIGLSPAMIRLLSEERAKPRSVNDERLLGVQSLYANALMIAVASGAAGLIITIIYALIFTRIYAMPEVLKGSAPWLVLWMGCGTMLRLMGDAPGALLQANQSISRDNFSVAEGELSWIVLSIIAVLLLRARGMSFDALVTIGFCHALSGVLVLSRRSALAGRIAELILPRFDLIDRRTMKRLIAFGALVLFAQLADYLYAPTDYILINKLLGWEQVAIYTPAMQIDAGLLLLVSGLSNVILPKAALAHTSGNMARIRRYYGYGTLISALLLVLAGGCVWLLSGWIFRAWLGNPMPATQAILPLVLVHTVVGGSSGVGRSILLGMGKVRAFTIAVLLGGVSNVVLSFVFVRYLHLGLDGIVLGTIVAVVARCALWMPWYVVRTMRSG
jgi:O-antigen/teichoic acid export membrane protein